MLPHRRRRRARPRVRPGHGNARAGGMDGRRPALGLPRGGLAGQAHRRRRRRGVPAARRVARPDRARRRPDRPARPRAPVSRSPGASPRAPRGECRRRQHRSPGRAPPTPCRRTERPAASPSSSPRARPEAGAARPGRRATTSTRMTVPGIGAVTVRRSCPPTAGRTHRGRRRHGRRRSEDRAETARARAPGQPRAGREGRMVDEKGGRRVARPARGGHEPAEEGEVGRHAADACLTEPGGKRSERGLPRRAVCNELASSGS